MQKPIILFSMPSSGSDWFADTIKFSQNNIFYYREFFNPATNQFYDDILSPEFGCEYISCYKNIFKYDRENCDIILKNTWNKQKFNFTKENYAISKAEFFVENFRCIAFTRDIENSFPPSRGGQVYGWYDAIYKSLLDNINNLPEKLQIKVLSFSQEKNNLISNFVFSFLAYKEYFEYQCKKFNIPIVRYENVIKNSKSDIESFLKQRIEYLNAETWTNKILQTRSHKKKDFYKLDCEWIISKYFTNFLY